MIRKAAHYYRFVCLALAVLIPFSVFAQQRTGRMQIPTQMSGKVLMEDGTPPPEPVQVEVVCPGSGAVPVARTDKKGGFVVGSAADINMVDARQGSSSARPGSASSAAPSVVPAGCSVQARLVGHVSTSVTVVNSTAVDLGTIILRRVAGVDGSMTSATSLNAPKDARKAFEKAEKAIAKQKLDQALPLLETATKIHPQYAAAWLELGMVVQNSGDVARARQAYQQAIAADAKFIKPYLALTAVSIREQKWREVADLTATVIKLNPYDFPAAYVYNAMSNFHLGDAKAAEASAREAVKLDTGHAFPEAEYTLGVVLGANGDYQGAVEHLRNYLKIAPNSPSAEAVKRQLAVFEQSAAAAPPK